MSPSSPTPGPARAGRSSLLQRLDQADRDVSRRLAVAAPHPRWFAKPLGLLSLTANYGALWYAIALLPWLLGQPRPLARALYVAVPVTLVEGTGFLIKLRVGRQRPPLADPSVAEHIPLPRSKSFPSSHASMAMAGTMAVSAFAPQALPALGVLTIALCFSRVYLGVHYAGDVLAGAVYGTFVGAIWVVLVPVPR